MTLPILALSVRQPWAWAIIHAGKDIENRTARAVTLGGMRPGEICIHAAKGMTRDEYEEFDCFMDRLGIECPRPDTLIRGAIIGTVKVIAIVQESTSRWFFGPRGLQLAEPRALDPIPARGELGYFEWQKNTAAAAIDAPLPWMRAWPDDPRRAVAAKPAPTPAPMPLFEGDK